MNLAKVSANGQVTVPMVINNASTTAIINAQKAFDGAGRDFGVSSEDDVQLADAVNG